MSFGGGGGSSQISTAQDVALSNPADGQVLTYDAAVGKWKNANAPSGAVTSVAGKTGAVTLAAADVSGVVASTSIDAANGVASLDSSAQLPLSLLPAGSTLTVIKSGGVWPARPTSRSDIVVQWKGPDPSPAIVSSGTGGMLDNVDVRFVTP